MVLSLAARFGLFTCLTLLMSTWTVAQGGGGSVAANPAIVFVKTNGGFRDLSVMNADGARNTVVFTAPGSLVSPCWSPSGSSICFGINGPQPGLALLDVQVVSGKAVGSNFRRLVSGGSFTKSSWSPDGATIAFSNDIWPGIWTVPATGGTPTQLYPGPSSNYVHGLAWSPDSTQIAFGYGVVSSQGEISVLNTAGGPPFTVCMVNGAPVQLDWGRSGGQIVFHLEGMNGSSIHRVNATAGSTAQLVVSSAWWPTWSPDDARIAYTTGSNDNIVVRNLLTGSVTSTGAKGRFTNWRRF